MIKSEHALCRIPHVRPFDHTTEKQAETNLVMVVDLPRCRTTRPAASMKPTAINLRGGFGVTHGKPDDQHPALSGAGSRSFRRRRQTCKKGIQTGRKAQQLRGTQRATSVKQNVLSTGAGGGQVRGPEPAERLLSGAGVLNGSSLLDAATRTGARLLRRRLEEIDICRGRETNYLRKLDGFTNEALTCLPRKDPTTRDSPASFEA
ncbi:hypothetical protein BV22DRAFT_1181532 [Leucogyrophana mollusca]|uniref:Uncharacterized protein n=1 Tax=Leucogyrophana mollusca TaxID=85980 RepID=A0ACB8B3C1_9AGAM|nr:hypothetical protein BV22DRAFT_1181532 [Leucogyrophana mollusca]